MWCKSHDNKMTSLENQVSKIENGFNFPTIHKKLDWTVREEGLKSDSGIIYPDKKCIIRDDTNMIIGAHSKGYHILQNSELWELVCSVAQKGGFGTIKSGIFDGGAKVWVQIETNSLTLGNDKVQGYSTGINSFDGTTSLGFGASNVTISCKNSFFSAYRGLEKIRHTGSMATKIRILFDSLNDALREEEEIFNNIERLTKVDIDENLIKLVKNRLFDIDRKAKQAELKGVEISTKTLNQIEEFNQCLTLETEGKGQNVWGLFSGVTKYTTHIYGNNDRNDGNMKEKIFSNIGNIERGIFHELTHLVLN